MSAWRGSVLIIVLWITFGLVSLTLYFAHSMSMELRMADHRVAALEAEQAIAGALRYATNLLATLVEAGTLPETEDYDGEGVLVGEARFWMIGRGQDQGTLDRPYFRLVDEASKLNLNTATAEMLEMLPFMTPELAAAILDWRDSDSTVSEGGAEEEIYQRFSPPYRCKNAPFESVEELRLVYGMTLELLFGEDTNLNGVLDANENDAEVSLPLDNRNGRLDPGLLEYVTVSSREPNTRTNGEPRINVSNLGGTNQQSLATLLQEKLGTDRANQILLEVGTGGRTNSPGQAISSVLEFYQRSGMTAAELALIEGDLSATDDPYMEGLINVNTASETVLACVPGIGTDHASSLVAYRRGNPDNLTSVAWVSEVLSGTNLVAAAPYLTARSYQFTADIAALGRFGRGYQRVKFILDTTDQTPRIVYRQDLSHLGWALGREVREEARLAQSDQTFLRRMSPLP